MQILPLFIAIPMGAAFVLAMLLKARHSVVDILANVVTAVLLALSITLIMTKGTITYEMGRWAPPLGIVLVLDGLTVLMLLIVNLIAFLATIFSISYMERFTAKAKFYSMFMLMLTGLNGVILTGDIFNMFVFLEIASIASYVLVAFGTEDEELEASFKYMVISSVGGLFILLSIALLYAMTGTLNMAHLSQIISSQKSGIGFLFTAALMITGFAIKAAIVPFHAWLPDAHPSAPSPVSAMLSGVFIKTLGIYAMMRVLVNVIGISILGRAWGIMLVLGAVSMVIGALLGLGQKDYKRLLAYSSVSQVGYIILAFGLGTPLGYLAALFHLTNHAVFKALMFFNAGAVEYATGTRDLEKMGGLSEKMPVTGITSVVGTLSISGVPPFNGFWSKLLIIIACIQAGRFSYAVIAILVSVLTLAYFLKVQRLAFFGKIKETLSNIKEVPVPMRVSLIVLAVLCLVIGLDAFRIVQGMDSSWLVRVLLNPAKEVLVNGTGYVSSILPK
ncbi:NADH/ubiquinone/plastoquinone (complex I) [Candidatus Desantisbacteria bacterium CG_4_10_14_0_8_um_filter_48_22]|uniref:NADH/ubiquinone/plastoquinone (Complex I) n=1 Tax=Candidatus Desantisbacteria bacterium CG_4_10_14_0_8_um_filter_48_22 TaxID=1974543 RepID=A0A2M7S972_9BACT|nr:MAG: hypothetical protein AUJ67_08425 [Candidatus Desantisbacteria bacterium CG1_02_49_89]PIV57002.1 MAG: NADH/ubiquinone/plastoquinone (complex I) [Candidatus Desantisbacteria bacterium CG02_land_8_20_14_3_00_49_13]PIZ15998.1 MAG: NADH/ubiquinone/plastoquinone (complex I) [Candidatus Desantisbacteria bacterium CG_4_10_14_0_8_um_filter_48_22]